jgi:hypothetical protein
MATSPEAARIARRGVTGSHIRRKKDLSITCPLNCPAPLNLMDVTSWFALWVVINDILCPRSYSMGLYVDICGN